MYSRHLKNISTRSVSIIVPLFNEEESIQQLHDRLLPVIAELRKDMRVQLILVDDGSTDTTFEMLYQYFGGGGGGHREILRHESNQGIAAAMRTGFKAVTGQIVCTLDCDCSYAPEELLPMIRLLEESGADIVTASPYHPAVLDRESSHRLFLSRACSQIYRYLAPEQLYCYTSFFRVCRREWARADMFSDNGFLGVTEYMLVAAYCGATIAEYPAPLGTRRYGRSKMRTLQVIADHLGLIVRTMKLNASLRLSRMLGGHSGPDAIKAAMPLQAFGLDGSSQLGMLDHLGQYPLDPARLKRRHLPVVIHRVTAA